MYMNFSSNDQRGGAQCSWICFIYILASHWPRLQSSLFIEFVWIWTDSNWFDYSHEAIEILRRNVLWPLFLCFKLNVTRGLGMAWPLLFHTHLINGSIWLHNITTVAKPFIAIVNICIYSFPHLLQFTRSYLYVINYLPLYVSRNASRQLDDDALEYSKHLQFLFIILSYVLGT